MRTRRKVLVAIEDAGTNLSAFCPNMPGVIAVGDTIEEVRKNILETLRVVVRENKRSGVETEWPDDEMDFTFVTYDEPDAEGEETT